MWNIQENCTPSGFKSKYIFLLTEEALPLQENVCTLILSSNWLSLSELLDIILMLDKSTNNQEYSRLFDGAD